MRPFKKSPNPDSLNATNRSLFKKYDNYRMENVPFNNVIDYGKFYYPAWKHYKVPSVVTCDCCWRQNLLCCVSYDKFDLCMSCVDELTRNNYDCASTHCHDSLYINDNLITSSRTKYEDPNKFNYI